MQLARRRCQARLHKKPAPVQNADVLRKKSNLDAALKKTQSLLSDQFYIVIHLFFAST